MQAVFSVMAKVVTTLLSGLLIFMFARALLTILAPDSDHPVVNVVFNVTDVVMAPARALLDKTGWFQNSMIDMSYLFTVVFLFIISSLFMIF